MIVCAILNNPLTRDADMLYARVCRFKRNKHTTFLFLVLGNDKQSLLIHKSNDGVTAIGYCMRTAAGRIYAAVCKLPFGNCFHRSTFSCVPMWSHRDINDQYSAHISASASDPVLSWIVVMPDADAAVIDGKTFYLHKHPL